MTRNAVRQRRPGQTGYSSDDSSLIIKRLRLVDCTLYRFSSTKRYITILSLIDKIILHSIRHNNNVTKHKKYWTLSILLL